MPKKTKEQVIAELDARQISYNENMSYSELLTLLPKEEAKPVEEKPLDIPEVTLGVTTINDHERRICIIERILKAVDLRTL